MSKSLGSSSGQIYVLVAMAMTVLIGMAGLVVDVGLLYVDRRQMQTAADAAAVAGANALHGSSTVSAGYQTAATDAAGNNGFTNGVNRVSITATEVSCPGAAGQQCVQTNVSQPVPIYLLRALGYTTMNVGARAIAGGVNSPACVFALDPTAGKAVTVDGSAGISSACGILVNSNDSEALYGGSSSNTVTASAIGVQGGANTGPGWTPTPQSGIAPAPDPLMSYVEPTVPTACDPNPTKTNFSTSSDANLTAGTYCGGIKISGTGTINFGSGLYILMGGGMAVTGGPTLNGTAVTFFNTGGMIGSKPYNYGNISLAGGGTVTFSAPTSGPQQGMLFLDDRSIRPTGNNTKDAISGGASSVFDGILYFPNSQLSYAGSSNTAGSCTVTNAGYTSLIADTLIFNGGQTDLICDDFSSLGGTDPLSSNTFYE